MAAALAEPDVLTIGEEQPLVLQMFGDGAVEDLCELEYGQVPRNKARPARAMDVFVQHVAAQFRETDDLHKQFAKVI